MASLLHPEKTMLQFTYNLKLTERVKAKCSRHPRYNPVKDGRAGIRGGCSTCFSLYDLHQAPHRPRRRTARVCSQSRSVGAATRTPPEESRRRNRGTSLASLELR